MIQITEHAMQKYVERIQDRNGLDAKTFLVQNKDKIMDWIEKLYEHSKFLYSGKVNNNQSSHFYINNDGWILVFDENKVKLVTIYKVDLGLGIDFNKAYIDKMYDKIQLESDKLVEKEIELIGFKEHKTSLINQNNDEISDLKKRIELFESQNEIYQREIKVANIELQNSQRDFDKMIKRFLYNEISE